MIIAHRGTKPENKMAAFRDCIAMRVRGIECDVRLSMDNKAVVIHDPKINRVTGCVSKMTLESLRKYDIPALDDVLDLLKPHTNIHLFVEVKDVGRKNKVLVQEVVNSINARNMTLNCYVISFRPSILQNVKALCSRIRTGYIHGPLRGWGRNPFKKAKACNADMLWLHYSLVKKTTTMNDIPIFAWTVNDQDNIDALKDFGVSGIITDVPEFLLPSFKEMIDKTIK